MDIKLWMFAFVFVGIRYILKRKSVPICNVFSYFIYFFDVAGIIYYIDVLKVHNHILVMIGFIVVCCVIQIVIPLLTKNKIRDNRVVNLISNIHENVLSGFMFFGLFIQLFLRLKAVNEAIGLFFFAYIINIFYYLLHKRKKNIEEMHILQNISGFFAIVFLLCTSINTNITVEHVFIYMIVLWLFLLIMYVFNLVDPKQGTFFWWLVAKNKTISSFRFKRMGKRFANFFITFFVLIFWIFVVNTLEFYYVNKDTLGFELSDFWFGMIVRAILIAIIISLFVILLKADVVKGLSCIIGGAVIASYLQVMIFNKDIGITDAYVIIWSDYYNKMVINGIIWLLCLVIPVMLFIKYKKRFFIIMRWIVIALFFVQMSATIYLLIKCNEKSNNQLEYYYVSAENEFTVSKKNNVIVFVLDTYSNDFVDEMLKIYPDALDELHDFTYYNNYDGKYDGTALAMNYLLTGEEFDNTIPCKEYSRRAFLSESATEFYNNMNLLGYSCNIYTDGLTEDFLGAKNLYNYYNNVKKSLNFETRINENVINRNILRGAFYKVLPLVLKRYSMVITSDFDGAVVMTGKELDDPFLDNSFYNELDKNGLSYNDSQGTFSIYHFIGMHNYGTENTNERADSAYVCLQQVYSYIKQLQDMNVYDDSTIIITADHGKFMQTDGIQPIFFIKEPYSSKQKITINTAPVCSTEFMPTVLYLASSGKIKKNKTIYDFKAYEERERKIFIRHYKEKVSEFLTDNFSSYSSLYQYIYTGNKEDLRHKADGEPNQILELIDFWQ